MTNPILLEIPQELHTERLTLRMPRAGRDREVFEVMQASLPELRLWLEFAQNPPTLEECEIRLRENHARFLLRQNLQFEIFDASSDAFLGRIGFPFVNWKVPKFEIGYWLDSREAGKGYITEAVLALTGLAFAVLGAKRVEIFCNARNSASRRVAEKAGFTLEGILKNNAVDVQDATLWVDDCVYARVRP